MYKKLLILFLGLVLNGCGGSSGEKTTPPQPIIQSYEVSASASVGGAISPSKQSIRSGSVATFNISLEEGYEIEKVFGCNGSLNGDVYTTDVITAACEVSAAFVQSYEVSASASVGGAISPSKQSIRSGSVATFNISLEEGYEIESVVGCNGSLNGNVYTTDVITANCSVSATFKLKTYTVSTLVPDHGVTISPSRAVVAHDDVVRFNIWQNSGIGYYEISGCNGRMDGTFYILDSVTSDCQIVAEFKGDFLGLSLYPQHEDSSIEVSIDLTQTEVPHSELGFVIYKENNVEYYYSENMGRIVGGSIRMPINKKVYRKIVPNLQPNSEYEICLSGIHDFWSTGYFSCKKIKTTQKKSEEIALVVIGHDVEFEAIPLIDEWIDRVESKNSHIKMKKYSLQSGDTAESIKLHLESEYNSSNLKHVVFVGYDIPSLKADVFNVETKLLGLYSSLSAVKRGDWYNEEQTEADEVTIAAIMPQGSSLLTYFRRVINYYDGVLVYPKRILFADAKITSEKTILLSDLEKFEFEIDTVAEFGSSVELSEAIDWKEKYSSKLLNNEYELLFIAAHGIRLEHEPCAYDCINYDFIKRTEPKVKFIIAISCNIGHVFTEKSPMISYIFSPNSGSLSGLASEVLYIDDGSSGRRIVNALKERQMSIGDVSKIFGFLVIGDPFLTLH